MKNYHIQRITISMSRPNSQYRLDKSNAFQPLIELSSVGIINYIRMKIEVTHYDKVSFGDGAVLKKF